MDGTTTLRDHLATSRIEVTVDEFNDSKQLGPAASWAVWGDAAHDMSIFKNSADIAPKLRKDVVLIGANFGLIGDRGDATPFTNFHARSSGGDTKLRNGVTGTQLEGAFLTDLVKEYPTAHAANLRKEITSRALDIAKHVVDGFFREQETLGLDLDTLYIPMGAEARRLWDLLVALGALPAGQRVFHRLATGDPAGNGKPVRNLRHYSSAVNMSAAVATLLDQRIRL